MDKFIHTRKKFIVIVCGAVIAGALFGFIVGAPFAKANPLTDFFKNLLPSDNEEEFMPSVESGAKDLAPPYQSVETYEEAVIHAVEKASPAVVSITISKNVPIIENCRTDPFGNLPSEFRPFFDFEFFEPCERGTELREVGGGSGFIISSDGLIVTNKHVVRDTDASYTVFTNDGKKYDATVLARDPIQDLAIIKIKTTGLPTLKLGNSDALKLGQTVIAIGNALGEFRNTVSVGVVSGLSRSITASGGEFVENIKGLIQTDAAINEGNSGGPLLNLKGEIMGINTAIVSGAQNIGFTIPINHALRAIDSVKRTGEIQLPFLGVRYVTITPDIAKEQKLPMTYGALLRGTLGGQAVEPGSPAEKAGLRAEDIIFEIQGILLKGDNELVDIVSRFNVGDVVKLKIFRDNKELVVSVTLARRPQD